MQPYDDLRGHVRETPEDTLIVVGLDLCMIALVGLTVAGFALDHHSAFWIVVVVGTGVIVWVIGGWSFVAEWREWE